MKQQLIKVVESSLLFQAGESRNVTAVDTLLDLARNLFPPNLVQVTFT